MTGTEKRVIVLQCVCDIITPPKATETDIYNAINEAKDILEAYPKSKVLSTEQIIKKHPYNNRTKKQIADLYVSFAYGLISLVYNCQVNNIKEIYKSINTFIEDALTLLID